MTSLKQTAIKLGAGAFLLAATLGSQVAFAAPVELVTNGGFETGTLSSWNINAIGTTGTCPSADRNWNASTSGSATGCSTVANPSGSTYAAYVMGDGIGPLTYKLSQTITDPVGVLDGILSFDWASVNMSDAGRTFSVVLDGSTVFSSSTSGNFGWTHESFDVSALLAANAGTPITLEFDNFIPSTWTGPAGLGLDNVSISANVPEPVSLALLGIGLLGFGASRKRKQA